MTKAHEVLPGEFERLNSPRSEREIIIGRTAGGGKVSVTLSLTRRRSDGPEFSAQGEAWERSYSRDCYTAGQNLDHLADEVAVWSIPRERFDRIRELWERWHLNGMKPGCEHQRAEKWAERPIDPAKPTNAYGKHFPGQGQDSWNMLAWVTRAEHPEGLLSFPCPTCGYEYGSAWLFEPMPDAIEAEVRDLIENGVNS